MKRLTLLSLAVAVSGYATDGSGSGSAVTFANLALDEQTEAAKLISLVNQV